MTAPAWFALLQLVHLLAATVWVGGMAVVYFAVRPAAAQAIGEPPLRLRFMAALLGRFFAWVSVAVLALLASGLALVVLGGGFARVHWSVHAMLAIGLVMMAIFGHVRFAPYPRLQRAVDAGEWKNAAAGLEQIRVRVAVNLALGVVVYAVAVLGRVL